MARGLTARHTAAPDTARGCGTIVSRLLAAQWFDPYVHPPTDG